MRKCIFQNSCTPTLVFRGSILRLFIRVFAIHEVVLHVNNIIIILNVFTKNVDGTLALDQLECQRGFIELHVRIDNAQFAGPEHSKGYLHNVLGGADLDYIVLILSGLDAQKQLLNDELVAAWIIVGEAVPGDGVGLLVQRDAIELAICIVHCVDLINHNWPLYGIFFFSFDRISYRILLCHVFVKIEQPNSPSMANASRMSNHVLEFLLLVLEILLFSLIRKLLQYSISVLQLHIYIHMYLITNIV